ncbi:putative transcriptional repressor of cell division inhibition protein [Streptomyces sp. CBMAI 2042]|uniref:helix-turn-helix domain-containing protein n=1 Tax=Streptomyces sp. CBMAI 2042 TaxID=2305222 RepID=UPI000F1FE211|nr:helix-turn-helix domain-containing protein [Streptomyces sp. CBMAI 2042]RLV66294.1 putative transcriptional repressor of cell division inhibition protein [Streptomyces sp. CBMAI 2042]
MATEDTTPTEDLAQLLARLKDEYGVNDSQIATAIGVSVSTVNTWVHRKRQPRPDALRALAAAYPKFTEDQIFAAAGRKTPGPLSPAAEERLLELFRGLTAEQQEIKELELRALNEHNRSALS